LIVAQKIGLARIKGTKVYPTAIVAYLGRIVAIRRRGT
jgi:hypothetical protein